MNDNRESAVVTGASGGIGCAIVEQLASEKYNVWALVHHKNEEIEKTFDQVAKKNEVEIEIVEVEFLNMDLISDAIKAIIKSDKNISVLVNNAGMPYDKTLSLTSMVDLEKTLRVNFVIPSYIIQLVSRVMIKNRKGYIVNIISRAAMEVRSGTYAYGSSKAALAWGTRATAKELAAYNIRVNGIAPGLTETKMGTLRRSEESVQRYVQINNIKRPARPEEIANVVSFLISDKSSYISGQIISVDGGRM
ncbi:SDR family oxidoreductase [Ruminococcus sp. OA3]|uniref:SDR family NAD(P)-dependent oxidoreductase n=1 Tax=Ruminococcus sp. OA3 TaxID=2914164 RepID=UPI001F06F9F8|nr:SDR family oxidoreductase [Ruminococcus sp. OA3]MCH1982906.1 SDR family oxidoreductase [Ruminococcus sp. OA3]